MANVHIITFIQSLSDIEIKTAEDYLQKIQPLFNAENKEVKELKLFEYIVANRTKAIKDSDILEVVSTSDLSHLKLNLYNKILESLTSDKHINNTALFDGYDIITFTLKKKLLVFKVLFRSLNQGKTEALNELLNDIIETAVEYEVYEVCSEALTLKKYFKGIRLGVNEFEKINSEITFYDYCYKAALNAGDAYYRLILNNDFIKSSTEKEQEKHIRSSISQMEKDYKKTKSQQVNYFLHIMNFALYEREKNYVKAIEYCNQLINITKKSKVLFRKERIGFALSNLTQLKTRIGDYEGAAIDAKKAQEYHFENSFNYLIAKEQEFYSHFYAGNLKKATICIEEMLEHSLIDTGEFRKSKFVFYQSCILFATGKYKETLDLLNKSLEIEKDKSRWNISLRILNIITFIELDKIDEASNSLESLRKYMERTAKSDELKVRDILIVKLLREIEKNGFAVDPADKELAKMIKDLSEKNKSTSWEHYSTELIPFHEWLVAKKK